MDAPLPATAAAWPARIAGLANALPDAVTAGFFLLLWLRPAWLPQDALRTAMLMMIVEFVLLHASGLLGNLALAPGAHRAWRLPVLALLGAFYGLFVAAWAWRFGAWWPLLALGWLLLARAWLLFRPLPPADARDRLRSEWAIGALAYIVGIAATALLPIPALGLGHDVVAAAALPAERGLWLREPQALAAFGLFHFGVMALCRGTGWRLPGTAARAPA